MRGFIRLAGLGLAIGLAGVTACTGMHELTEGPRVVPEAEEALAGKKGFEGPTQTRGIRSVTPVGSVPLAGDFPAMEGRQLRAREIVVEPGGVVAVHEHDARPGVAYILEGEIFEHRNDQTEPILRKKGDAAFEKTGVAHWWENRSGATVRALVVDIVPTD